MASRFRPEKTATRPLGEELCWDSDNVLKTGSTTLSLRYRDGVRLPGHPLWVMQ